MISLGIANAKYLYMLPKWKRCRDVSEGQDAVHAAGEAYLPRLQSQNDTEYEAYKTRAGFFNATWRTVAGLQGMIFRKTPRVEVPAKVEPMLDAVTECGKTFHVFALELTKECLITGRAGILVDFPRVETEGLTVADAAQQNLQPVLAMYQAEAIVDWQERRINNRRTLAKVVLLEDSLDEGEGGEVDEQQVYRVLDLFEGAYRVRLFDKAEYENSRATAKVIGEEIFPKMNGATLQFIPFYFASTSSSSASPEDPPLIDLVDTNLSHYRSLADYEHGCHFTGLPTGYVTGHTASDTDSIFLGSQTMLVFPDPETKVGFLEFTGAGLKTLENNLDRKEQQMAVLGARMLEVQKKGVESVDTAMVHRSGESSLLASISQTLSEVLEKALSVFSTWAGADGTEVEVDLNRDFFPMPIDAQRLTALVASWQQGAISKETLFQNLQQAEIVSNTSTFEDEETKIANSMSLQTGADQ